MKWIADEMYPMTKKIRLVMDNFKTHDASAFYEMYVPEEAKRLRGRFEFIFTPKHGSWLNIAETELQVLNGQCLNLHIATVKEIKSEIDAWQNHRNNKSAWINWQFTNKARIKLKGFIRQFRINTTVVCTFLHSIIHAFTHSRIKAITH